MLANGLLIHMLGVGLPSALFARDGARVTTLGGWLRGRGRSRT